eukprot:gene55698-74374_t
MVTSNSTGRCYRRFFLSSDGWPVDQRSMLYPLYPLHSLCIELKWARPAPVCTECGHQAGSAGAVDIWRQCKSSRYATLDGIAALEADGHDYIRNYNRERIKFGLQGFSPLEYRLIITV